MQFGQTHSNEYVNKEVQYTKVKANVEEMNPALEHQLHENNGPSEEEVEATFEEIQHDLQLDKNNPLR